MSEQSNHLGERNDRLDACVIDRIALITDFGTNLYIGQMHGQLDAQLPELSRIDLIHDLPSFRPDLAAYLLPALIRDMPAKTLYLCVIDPGVGGSRAGLVIQIDQDWLIGPDNGLFSRLLGGIHAGQRIHVWRIGWRPEHSSATFHGRDWFAPTAVRLYRGIDAGLMPVSRAEVVGADWPDERACVLYADHYGNLMTGLAIPNSPAKTRLRLGSSSLRWARAFCEVDPGQAFWYENSLGLVEIAVNQRRADEMLGLAPGDPVGPFDVSPPEQ